MHREQGQFAAEPRAHGSGAGIAFRIAASFFGGGTPWATARQRMGLIRAKQGEYDSPCEAFVPFRSLALPAMGSARAFAVSPPRHQPPGLHLITARRLAENEELNWQPRPTARRRCQTYYATKSTDRYEPAAG